MSDIVRIRWSLSVGLVGCRLSGVEEYEREDWEGMTPDQQEEEIQEIVFQKIEWDYSEE